jgi:hypothetical protein
LTIAFLCLLLVPIHTFTQDDVTTIRIGSAAAALFAISDNVAVPTPRPRSVDPSFVMACLHGDVGDCSVCWGVNIVWASLGLLQVVILALLTSPLLQLRQGGWGSSGSVATTDPGD